MVDDPDDGEPDPASDDRPDEAGSAATPSGSGDGLGGRPEERLVDSVAANPTRSLLAALAVVLVLVYAVLVQAELLLAIWLLLAGFLVYLLVRFVRAHERLAAAAERVADEGE